MTVEGDPGTLLENQFTTWSSGASASCIAEILHTPEDVCEASNKSNAKAGRACDAPNRHEIDRMLLDEWPPSTPQAPILRIRSYPEVFYFLILLDSVAPSRRTHFTSYVVIIYKTTHLWTTCVKAWHNTPAPSSSVSKTEKWSLSVIGRSFESSPRSVSTS